jgi:hypothetical protein
MLTEGQTDRRDLAYSRSSQFFERTRLSLPRTPAAEI